MTDADDVEAVAAKALATADPHGRLGFLFGLMVGRLRAQGFDDAKLRTEVESAIERCGVEALQAKNAAYVERNALVCALSKLWPSHMAMHPEDPAWEREWTHIVCIHAPVGQLTWHIHDSEVAAFAHLEMRPNDWDGHSTDEKYRRLASLVGATEGSG